MLCNRNGWAELNRPVIHGRITGSFPFPIASSRLERHPSGLLRFHVFCYTVSDMQAWRMLGGQKGGAEKVRSRLAQLHATTALGLH